MKKKKVLHFTIANTAGGGTKFILRLWDHIDKEKFHFDFVTTSKTLDYAQELEAQGCKIHYLKTYAEVDRQKFDEEIETMLDEGYDIVHLHTSYWRSFALEEVARRKGVEKIIIHSHNTDVDIMDDAAREKARELHYHQRELLNEDTATDFLACSDKAAEWLYGDRIQEQKVKIIPNAIEIEDYKYDALIREEYREKLGLQKEDYVIGHIGRFAFSKNHEYIIEVFREVCERNTHSKLLLIGIGELEENIHMKVQKCHLEDKVMFLGKREDVSSLMQAMDTFILPSRTEGFGLVLLEAQAAGLKCIASKEVPAMVKVTENVDFLPFEKEKWVEKILQYADGYERKDMSDAMKEYDMEALARKMEDIYNNE